MARTKLVSVIKPDMTELSPAADQVVPEETYQDGPIPLPDNDPRTIRWNRNRAIRRQLLAIAAELNGTQSFIQKD